MEEAATMSDQTALVETKPEFTTEVARAKMLAGERLEQYKTLLTVVDPRPRVVGLGGVRKDDETTNKDFIVINGNLEIRRDFGLKVLGLFGFEWQANDPQVLMENGQLQGVVVTGKVNNQSCMGACQPGEDAPKKWASSRGGGGLHACVAIAETRCIKRGIEAALGLPALNLLMREVFPEWDWEEGSNRPMRNVTGTDDAKQRAARGESAKPAGALPPKVQRLRKMAHALMKADIYTEQEAVAEANRAYFRRDNDQALDEQIRAIENEFTSRGMGVPDGV